ncbi:lysophospholipid acyltransferase family protein [Flavobacterium aciduliphilum]|uniref:1-acyl-sn-glycerol-3-phosphate acyltransferase n=1 Tax=Flavobacterium aciduliphilum TaxID=1101402 RepID=A0A328YJ85_9FLAO|nr:lysophospholipid acyltransferase family protein [Flavobacterium aciduliphilum]RAR72825.1 1-acyl-sn-glycerol-3-phosphate acyltransferase [Flavobacterium aciduliphilum]
MIVLKTIFWILWRIWFYIVLGSMIVLLFPFLTLSILKEKWYPYFFMLARIWAKVILFLMGFYIQADWKQELDSKKSYMLIANHTSMIDIMLMLVLIRNPFVFVGKKELSKIPLFGFFYKRTCILVDRSSSKSRGNVYGRAEKRLKQGLSICIFPEGGVPDESIELDGFKEGAFRLAIEHQIPIVPLTFGDNKKRFSYTFFSGSPGKLRATIHPFIETLGLTSEHKKELKESAHQIILEQLKNYNS